MVDELVTITKYLRFLLIDEQFPTNTHLLDHLYRFYKSYPQKIKENDTLRKYLKDIYRSLAIEEEKTIDKSSWLSESVPEGIEDIPYMLYEDSFRYYSWLGRNFSGFGEIIELGCWMGATSFLVASGLSQNVIAPDDKKMLHAIDTFEWDDEMYQYCNHKNLVSFKNGDDFLEDFKKFTSCYESIITPHRHRIDRNTAITKKTRKKDILSSHSPIEYLIQDIAPDYDFNKYIWDLYSDFFVDGKTILVYGEYGNFSSIDLRKFVSDHSSHLVPIHRVRGNVRAFLYRK